jgi:IPT/TIG domain-containing protein
MRTPTFSTKRVLGVTAAATLALTGIVGLAGSSQAAVASVTLSPKTGSSAGGTIVTISGKGFQTAAGATNVGQVFFSTSACAAAASPSNAASVVSVISDTKITITTPALTLTASKPTAYNLCIENVANSAINYATTFTSYAPPSVTATGLSTTSGASYGGGTLTITGDDFTTKATAMIGGKALTNTKVVIGSGTNDDTLTGTVPAGSGATLPVVLSTEGGPVTATQTFTYLDSVKVNAPAYGNGTDNDVISLTGTGFSSRTWGTAAKQSTIGLVAAGTNIAAAQAVPTTKLCDTIQVESDTDLSCQISGAVADGAYSVVIFTRDATTATNIGSTTALSRSATYTVSDY